MAQQQRSHVPRFGNWESDNIPYTAYFEKARKDKTGMINPNDPEQNPEAFLNLGKESQAELSFGQKKINIATASSESGQSSDNSVLQRRPGKSDSTDGGQGSSLSTSSVMSRHHRKTSADTRHERAASIPKFGAWDEADPSSGAGFTVIFNKVKKEKKTKLPPSLPYYNSHAQDNNNHQTSSSVQESKFCCGLFSRTRKVTK